MYCHVSSLSQHPLSPCQNPLALLLTGLGISTIGVHEFFGGLFLALAAGSVVARARKDKRKLLVILSMAALAAVLMAGIWPQLGWTVPVQVGMALAGAASSWVINLFVKVGDRIDEKSGPIADRLIDRILPDDKKK